MSDHSNESQQAPTKVASEQQYDAAQIDKLEGLEAVRKRPGMYIGDPDERGLHHCVFEVLDNSIDEHLAGYCNRIKVSIHVDGSVSITDNGRGIPVDMHPKFGMPAVELVLTNLHAGGKFGQGAYKYSGGLHGVGAKCVNALADWFRADIMRNGKVHRIAFGRGKTTEPLHVVGEVDPKKTGTTITFFPDATIFVDTIEFKFDRLATRLRELAFLNPGLTIDLEDERPESAKKGSFFYAKGIEEFVVQLGENKTVIHDEPVILHGKRQIDLDYDGKQTTDDVFADSGRSSSRSMVRPGLRKASSRRRVARRSNLNSMVSTKMVASGKKVMVVPVFFGSTSPTTWSGSVVLPRSKPMRWTLPLRMMSARNQSARALTHLAPTP